MDKEPAGAPPPPVIPWRVPPMGSMGDAWDAVVDVPRVQRPTAAEAEPKVPRRRHARQNEVVFIEYIPPLHWGVVAAWIFLGMALVSTGAAYPLMSLLALCGTVCGVTTALLLRTVHRDNTGERLAWVAMALGLCLIVLDLLSPNERVYQTYFRRSLRTPVTSLDFPARMKYSQDAMNLMAHLAWCAYQVRGTEAVGIGRNSVNRGVTTDPEYFGISSLAHLDNVEVEGLGEDFLPYEESELPRDPFARDPAATFGVFITPTGVMVYSMGPDGVWQINPRQPVNPYSQTPLEDLIPHLFPATGSESSSGDLVLIVPMEAFEQEDFDMCLFIGEQYEEYQKSGHVREIVYPEPDDWGW